MSTILKHIQREEGYHELVSVRHVSITCVSSRGVIWGCGFPHKHTENLLSFRGGHDDVQGSCVERLEACTEALFNALGTNRNGTIVTDRKSSVMG